MFYPIFKLLLKPIDPVTFPHTTVHRKCLFKTLSKKHISTYKVIESFIKLGTDAFNDPVQTEMH